MVKTIFFDNFEGKVNMLKSELGQFSDKIQQILYCADA